MDETANSRTVMTQALQNYRYAQNTAPGADSCHVLDTKVEKSLTRTIGCLETCAELGISVLATVGISGVVIDTGSSM
jgi:hypothetical protein